MKLKINCKRLSVLLVRFTDHFAPAHLVLQFLPHLTISGVKESQMPL